MTIYDRNADANTAVTAFLTQFKVAAAGGITYVAGSHTYHVWWLHRALQKIVWDFTISGDDELNLSKPNPSTSEALGTIISLLDHTTDFSTNYLIDDTVASYLFGGSIVQGASGSEDKYYGLKVLGQAVAGTELQVVQNAVTLTSHWSTGKNQTDSNTLLRILVKTMTGGSEIDNSLVVVKAHEWQDTNAIWETTLGLGESVAAINTSADPQNTSVLGTVQGYGITKSEGYNLIDIDGNGNKAFMGEWSYSPQTSKKALYEYVKAILVRGSSDTLFGVDGDLWTGRVYDNTIASGSGTWVQNETLSWGAGATAGTGHLMAADTLTGGSTARLLLHLDTGVFPEAASTITGGGGATGVVSGVSVKLSTFPTHLGQFTGAWIGAFGIGFASGELTNADSVKDLDGNTLSPPNNVNIIITVETGLAGDDPHVFLAEKDAVLNAPDYTTNTVGAGNSSSDPDFVVTTAIASDTPQDGWFGVLDTTGGGVSYEFYHYSSWSGSTYTLDITDHAGGLDKNYTSGDPVFIALLYASAVGGGTTKAISNSLIYTSDIDVVGWVRHGDPANPDKPVLISGTIGTAGLTLTVVLDDES
ncbi:MAG: hypothetical protein DRH08_01030 [Deltaproteobacteria bacterium]|nr:MAG: hypothetical protein DRH08_01030 [Deltaproteobacteria bacterium]